MDFHPPEGTKIAFEYSEECAVEKFLSALDDSCILIGRIPFHPTTFANMYARKAYGHIFDIDSPFAQMYARKAFGAIVDNDPITTIFPQEITKLTAATLDKHPHEDKIKTILDRIGELSAVAQDLTYVITSYNKLIHSDHDLYLMIDANDDNGKGSIVGYLKLGTKRLYMTDGSKPARPVDVRCVLDFYIHEECQRKGWGKHLFQHALDAENITPQNMAYDRPSDKLNNFLAKHYNLTDSIEQPNRFVVYRNFFDNLSSKLVDERCYQTSQLRSETGGFLVHEGVRKVR